MFTKGMIWECDSTGEQFDQPVEGYQVFARGATGRVCLVLTFKNRPKFDQECTMEELRAWAESVPGGYLDF